MQYILTQDEYDKLKSDKKLIKSEERRRLQEFCTRVANELPVDWKWGTTTPVPKPWGCIITANENDEDWYCDQCPAQEVCPYEYKSWSK